MGIQWSFRMVAVLILAMKTPNFPAKFETFLSTSGVALDDYCAAEDIPRYIRINHRTGCDEAAVVAELERSLSVTLAPVQWLPGLSVYSLPSTTRIAASKEYKDGLFFGIDAASVAAVAALGDISADDHVLDLCCAPGAKLCLLSNLQDRAAVSGTFITGTVTGVDISSHRIATCKSLVRKYKLERVRLFASDGTTFNVHAPSRVGPWSRPTGVEECHVPLRPKKRLRTDVIPARVKPFLATRLIANDPQVESSALLYDKVLVDAECTHDGSIVHLKKCDDVGWEKFENNFFEESKMDLLETLQNEDIVEWFLKREPRAVLENIPNFEVLPAAKLDNGENSKMLRFTPAASNTSGMFVARIKKL
ncbi:hypothetical protein HDU82_005252 [Entophlyctis luteolus]|nr:hypothetical protein HDU82_005252 [Entophlyctis luteolus]